MSMKLNFRATKDGEIITGTRESSDRFTLAQELRREGLTLLSAEPVRVKSSADWLQVLMVWRRVSLKEKIVLIGSLGSMIGAGLTLSRSLQVILKQTGNRYLRQVVGGVNETILAGRNLHEALAGYPGVFPPVVIAMVAAGEESGKLPQALEIVRDQLAKHYELLRRVRGAMIYPVIIILAIIILTILLMIFLVPNLTSLFRELEVELPFSTRVVIGISDFLSQNTFIFLAAVVLLIIVGWRFLKTRLGERWWTGLLLKLPILAGLVRGFNSAVTMRTLSSLIVSGVSLNQSLQITARVLQNRRYQTVLLKGVDQIEKGLPLSGIFAAAPQLYPPLVSELTEVGEETGALADMLGKGAAMLESEVDQTTKNLSTVIEPILMIVIGVAVGFFAVSMIGPIYSLTEKL